MKKKILNNPGGLNRDSQKNYLEKRQVIDSCLFENIADKLVKKEEKVSREDLEYCILYYSWPIGWPPKPSKARYEQLRKIAKDIYNKRIVKDGKDINRD